MSKKQKEDVEQKQWAPPAQEAPKTEPGIREGLYPTIAIVGRPNVGKSSLFNALLKEQISITDGRAGTTRDRVLHPITLNERSAELVDTGGIGIVDKQDLSEEVELQIDAALAAANIFVFVVDAIDGLTPSDRQIARRLRALGQPVVLVINKTEGPNAKLTVPEFAQMGFEVQVVTSAIHRQGIGELEDALALFLPETAVCETKSTELPRIAIVGRRNVGKSSFVNALAKQNRTVVSEIPGTTRDAVDILIEKDDQKFWLIDTAGLRRMKEPEGPVEFFAQVRTERAIRRADIVILMLEAKEGISTTDLITVRLILESNRPCMIVVNKWDQSEDTTTGEYAKYLEKRLPDLRNVPVCFTCANVGKRCWQTIDVALDLFRISHTQVSTPAFNKVLEDAERRHEPPVKKSRKPRLLYGLQVAVGPPTFVVYCRHAEYIDDKYKRYLSRFIREHMDLMEVPVRLFLRDSAREKKG